MSKNIEDITSKSRQEFFNSDILRQYCPFQYELKTRDMDCDNIVLNTDEKHKLCIECWECAMEDNDILFKDEEWEE